MSIFSAFVLFLVIWFLVLFLVLPLNITTQSERNHITQGTPRSAPIHAGIARKFALVTIMTIVVWIGILVVIDYGWISVIDIDIFANMRPSGYAPVGAESVD